MFLIFFQGVIFLKQQIYCCLALKKNPMKTFYDLDRGEKGEQGSRERKARGGGKVCVGRPQI